MEKDLNRAEQLWYHWEEKQQQLEKLLGNNPDSVRSIQQRKYDYLREGYYRLSENPTEKEKLFVHAVRLTLGKLEKQLYPHPVIRLLHKLKTLVFDKPLHLQRFNQQKTHNLEILKNKFAELGMASYTGNLEKFLDFESTHINISMTTQLPLQGTLDISLRLERDSFGQYRFENYQATVLREGFPDRTQTFYSDTTISAKEAVNLLEGRTVKKSFEITDGSMGQKWLKLDFSSVEISGNYKVKEFHADFDVKREMNDFTSKLGLTGLNKDKLIQSMEQGNQVYLPVRQSLNDTFLIEANPGEQSFLIRDNAQKEVNIETLLKKIEKLKQPQKANSLTLIKQKQPDKTEDQSLRIG